MKVKLLSYTKDPEQVVVAAIRQCYAAVGAKELKKKIDKETRQRLIKQVLASGHTSTLEHASFTFGIEGISRVSEIQLIRHRVGCSYSIQSGRYVKRGEAKFAIPVSIQNDKEILPKYKKILKEVQGLYNEMTDKGIKAEDARYLQPQSLQTKIVVTMNARALLHFLELRCCKRAQWEIQQLANLMLREVRKVAPIIFEKAGASCVTTGICWEGEKMSCGLYKDIKGAEVRTRI
ncbi:MAG: Thymidylate synthase ThyX [Candidatus Shapirobacteria bacterium GW2011_GWE1_38_10]|uniref:Flavin-dependent thymidylate synthase n=1 Tax=Candidatus Shapirobacteria bacterium GW2011_GWE1_38_10 TaxID=1618488 RepID=A0A0G0LDU3_9BACT|nr:MAG: Thymidylate synthase ThyX [Candidatus Shapirobacteria bacterium GW2011_GWF2_37_20]KKQ50831.1 MAG: Thymidylate synthase ThyX [Candidatus Shapirobacteria bacterium GW2011_GWE1_38_10]KKQ64870.1 MAG: Thymidylate synthase ThyX [Candidatus Shapirobacteria bacterium GW2011_GWF1_38_23]HBP51044.1 FAD-dependent thymidylate synthase [Candidatus Shapirobacteria bacterium]